MDPAVARRHLKCGVGNHLTKRAIEPQSRLDYFPLAATRQRLQRLARSARTVHDRACWGIG